MKQTIQIVLECESEIVGEVLAAANFAAKKRGKSILVSSIEEKKA